MEQRAEYNWLGNLARLIDNDVIGAGMNDARVGQFGEKGIIQVSIISRINSNSIEKYDLNLSINELSTTFA